MLKTKNILISTCGIGAATMFCLIVAVTHIINEMQLIENELNIEIEAFKVIIFCNYHFKFDLVLTAIKKMIR